MLPLRNFGPTRASQVEVVDEQGLGRQGFVTFMHPYFEDAALYRGHFGSCGESQPNYPEYPFSFGCLLHQEQTAKLYYSSRNMPRRARCRSSCSEGATSEDSVGLTLGLLAERKDLSTKRALNPKRQARKLLNP